MKLGDALAGLPHVCGVPCPSPLCTSFYAELSVTHCSMVSNKYGSKHQSSIAPLPMWRYVSSPSSGTSCKPSPNSSEISWSGAAATSSSWYSEESSSSTRGVVLFVPLLMSCVMSVVA